MESTKTQQPLGTAQRAALRMRQSRASKDWRPGVPWEYGSQSQTVRIMQSLERRGLVERIGRAHWRIAEPASQEEPSSSQQADKPAGSVIVWREQRALRRSVAVQRLEAAGRAVHILPGGGLLAVVPPSAEHGAVVHILHALPEERGEDPLLAASPTTVPASILAAALDDVQQAEEQRRQRMESHYCPEEGSKRRILAEDEDCPACHYKLRALQRQEGQRQAAALAAARAELAEAAEQRRAEAAALAEQAEEDAGLCNCENSLCRACTAGQDEGARCQRIGTVPCRYVGRLCEQCAAWMPEQYLLTEAEAGA
mgnify:CR=1 FL=1